MKNNIPDNNGFALGGKNQDFKKIVQWLGIILKCPICSAKYDLGKTQVIESEQDEAYNEARILIHSDCVKCKSSVMFNVEIRGSEVFSVGMVTDLTGKDSSKFKNLEPIHINDIIGIHKELKTFKGDFISALTQK